MTEEDFSMEQEQPTPTAPRAGFSLERVRSVEAAMIGLAWFILLGSVLAGFGGCNAIGKADGGAGFLAFCSSVADGAWYAAIVLAMVLAARTLQLFAGVDDHSANPTGDEDRETKLADDDLERH